MRTTLTSLAALLAVALSAQVAFAEPKDREATALAKQAMDGDYLGTEFKDAEKKLQKALKLCKQHCEGATRARLHLDLAIVYIAGLKKKDKGKRELQAALAADAAVELSPDFSTPEIEKAFVLAGGQRPHQAETAREPDDDEDESKKSVPPATSEAETDQPGAAGGSVKNWFSLGFEQDLLSYKQTTDVCSGAPQYQCFLVGKSFGGTIYPGAGDRLQSGVGFATKRVLVGYDRLLGDNITLGARLGFAFGGSPKATNGSGTAFLPLHAEARASYWFGDAPFARDGLRAYLGLAAGVAEVDGHVTVEYYVDQAGYQANAKGKLDAWRKTGNALLGVHAGLAYAFSKQHQLFLELRLLQMLGASALGGAVHVGYAFGL